LPSNLLLFGFTAKQGRIIIDAFLLDYKERSGDYAMVKIDFVEDKLILLWSMKSQLSIPLSDVKDVFSDPKTAHEWWKGMKEMGARIPGLIEAGTFYQQGKQVFWDVENPDQTIVLDLVHEHYQQIIIQVENPEEAIQQIKEAIASSRMK
jgi:hypothetical protein